MSDYGIVTKSSATWKNTTGELKKLNQDKLYFTPDPLGYPMVKTSEGMNVTELIPFHLCKKKLKSDKHKTVHFFIDDYKFEVLWSNPNKCLEVLRFYGQCISPTYSIWDMQPQVMNMWNMYRSRWVTRYLQENGIKVLVDVRWGDVETYDYVFNGIEKDSEVIINTVGTRLKANRKLFVQGFEEMLERVQPSKLHVYGEYMPLDFEAYFGKGNVSFYPSYWQERRGQINTK